MGNVGPKVEDLEPCALRRAALTKSQLGKFAKSDSLGSGAHGFFQCPRIALSTICGLSLVGRTAGQGWHTGTGLWNPTGALLTASAVAGTLWDFCVSLIGRADIEGSKSNVAMNAWFHKPVIPVVTFLTPLAEYFSDLKDR